MQNVAALRMPRECSIRCHLEMWSLGVPYLEDVPCMGMVGKLWNILNRCVKVYSQMISLLFVFYQLVTMQVWWLMACACMLQWSDTKWFLQNWNITPAWLTFLAMLAIYRRQRIWSCQCPVNHMWMPMLGASRNHGNVEMAECVAKQILEMKPDNAAAYVLLCQTSMLLLATGISVRMLNSRERKKGWRSSWVTPGLKLIMRCIH